MTLAGAAGRASGLYPGRVMHQRLRPRRHRLGYRIFQILVDLDELPALDRGLKLFGHNRAALISVREQDHGAGTPVGLKGHVDGLLAEAGISLDGGAIRLLCMPRVLGQVFNPLSLYFCHHCSGALLAILYEVNNTFGERHSYLIPVRGPAGPTVRQACDKRFHVSPFMDIDLRYDFDVRPPVPGATGDVFVGVRSADAAGPLLLATFRGRRRELTDAAIAAAVLSSPLLALKVVAAIHWEALKLWLGGIRLRPRPPASAQPVTIVGGDRLRPVA